MIVHPTLKLAKKLGVKDLAAPGPEIPGLDSWYANLIRLERLQYILFTNVPSLFSVIIAGRGITRSEHLFKSLDDSLRACLGRLGLWEPYLAILERGDQTNKLLKTVNRSVLGSMNDIVMHCEYYVEDRGPDLTGMADHVNFVIHKTTNYQHPVEHFSQLVLGREQLPVPPRNGLA